MQLFTCGKNRAGERAKGERGEDGDHRGACLRWKGGNVYEVFLMGQGFSSNVVGETRLGTEKGGSSFGCREKIGLGDPKSLLINKGKEGLSKGLG